MWAAILTRRLHAPNNLLEEHQICFVNPCPSSWQENGNFDYFHCKQHKRHDSARSCQLHKRRPSFKFFPDWHRLYSLTIKERRSEKRIRTIVFGLAGGKAQVCKFSETTTCGLAIWWWVTDVSSLCPRAGRGRGMYFGTFTTFTVKSGPLVCFWTWKTWIVVDEVILSREDGLLQHCTGKHHRTQGA